MRKALLVVPILMVVSCNTPSPSFEKIKIGSNKFEVQEALGKPNLIAAQGDMEMWQYEGSIRDGLGTTLTIQRWFVRFYGDRVESFGLLDYLNPWDPTQKVTIDKTDKITMESVVTKFDLATELAKLDKLKKDGLITAEDYEVLKKRAIEKAKE